MGERTRRRFTREFKLEAVRQVVVEGRTRRQVADELGLNANMLGRWIKQLRSDPVQSFPGNGNLKARDKEVENLLAREFKVEQPNRVWLGDTTYIRTEEGWHFLAALMDLCSRWIVGWNTADRNDRWLTLSALQAALRDRQPAPGLIHHTDQGGPYAAYEYQECLRKARVTSSMSRKGDCWDNAPMESFFSTLKRERVRRRRYWNRQEATEDLGIYLDRYNRVRRHSQLEGLSPVRFEASRFHS
jgi:transposase InsO family protein